MKRIGMKKASYMFFFLVMGMIFAAGYNSFLCG